MGRSAFLKVHQAFDIGLLGDVLCLLPILHFAVDETIKGFPSIYSLKALKNQRLFSLPKNQERRLRFMKTKDIYLDRRDMPNMSHIRI